MKKTLIYAMFASLLTVTAVYAATATTVVSVDDDGWTLAATFTGYEIQIQPASPNSTVWVRAQAEATADPTTATGGFVVGKGGLPSIKITDLVSGDEVFARSLSGSADLYVMSGSM